MQVINLRKRVLLTCLFIVMSTALMGSTSTRRRRAIVLKPFESVKVFCPKGTLPRIITNVPPLKYPGVVTKILCDMILWPTGAE